MKRFNDPNKRTNNYMNLVPNFSDAMQMDQAIYQLAAYDASKGLIMIPETADQAIDFQKLIAKRFNYFKRLIQNSEVSFSELQRTVIERNGPFPNKNHKLTTDQAIEQVIESSRQKDDEAPTAVVNVLQKLFEDIIKMSNKDQYQISSDAEATNNSGIESNPFIFPQDSSSDTLPDPQPNKDIQGEANNSRGKNGRKSKSNKNPKDKKDT